MSRFLYRCLLWLHPPTFRRRFAEELLWIFDESASTDGAVPLLADGVISFARQWVMHSDLWILVIALIGGLVPILIGYGSFIPELDAPIR